LRRRVAQLELEFDLRNSPAHMAMRQGDFGMMQWLNNYIWVIKQNGELERLHQKWLGDTMGDLTTF
jgi:polar amino acid transport system substrate-binding protein